MKKKLRLFCLHRFRGRFKHPKCGSRSRPIIPNIPFRNAWGCGSISVRHSSRERFNSSRSREKTVASAFVRSILHRWYLKFERVLLKQDGSCGVAEQFEIFNKAGVANNRLQKLEKTERTMGDSVRGLTDLNCWACSFNREFAKLLMGVLRYQEANCCG